MPTIDDQAKGRILEFSYGPNDQRFYQLKDLNGDYTVYIDKLYEAYGDGNSSQDTGAKLYIGDYAVYDLDLDPITGEGEASLQYLYRDRLGSVVSVADANGGLIDSAGRGFDPFGKPREDDWRDSDGQNGETPTQSGDLNRNDLTTRGFTGHEHLNETDLIHMNGRVYDYNLGRFLSVDPFIQFPENSQSMNAYSYILNNPLSGTDPTGYTTEAPDASQSGTGASSGGNSAADQAKARVRKTAPTGSNIKSQTRITASGGSAEFSGSGEFLSGSGDLGALMNTLHASGNGGFGAPTINMGNGEGNADIGSPNSGGNESGNSPNAQMDATGCQVPLRCDSAQFVAPAAKLDNSLFPLLQQGGSASDGSSLPKVPANPLLAAIYFMTYSPALGAGEGANVSRERELAEHFNGMVAGIRTATDNRRRDRRIFFHFTNQAGFDGIMAANFTILPDVRDRVFITTDPVGIRMSNVALFMGLPDKLGTHVIAFSLVQGVPLHPGTQPNELIHYGALRNGRHIETIVYAGENPFSDS